MKKILILMLFITIASFVNGQTTVTLNLPDPCTTLNVNNNTKAEINFTISPNPTDGRFTIKVIRKEIIGKVKIEITDMKGVLVFTEQIYSNNTKCVKTYHINSLTKGIYNISIIGTNYRETKQLVVN